MSVRDEWAVPCRDLAGRRRDLTVFVSAGRVVLIAPPGEAAVLTSLDVGRLRSVLRDAVIQVDELTDEHGMRTDDAAPDGMTDGMTDEITEHDGERGGDDQDGRSEPP